MSISLSCWERPLRVPATPTIAGVQDPSTLGEEGAVTMTPDHRRLALGGFPRIRFEAEPLLASRPFDRRSRLDVLAHPALFLMPPRGPIERTIPAYLKADDGW